MAIYGIEPYEPQNELIAVDNDIWIVEGPVIQMDYLFTQIPFPTRMTIVRLGDGGLWVHSPVALTPALKAAVDGLGPVRFLIAPNRLHYWWVPDWRAAYPEAKAFAAPGVREQAASKKRAVTFDGTLGDGPEPGWAAAIDQVMVPGGFITEADFFHTASRTAILTDLIENFELTKVKGWLGKRLVKWTGPADPDGKAPIDMRLTFLGRHRRMRKAVRRIIAWEPERVIIAHGRWYRANGTAELKRAFRWLGRF